MPDSEPRTASSFSPAELSRRLEVALDASREAAELILRYFRSDALRVELKSDQSPVTVADREAEQLIRARLTREFPGDGVLGEEFGESPSSTGCRWIVDPIDGTKSFVHGVPLFGTLIGLEAGDRMVLGVARFPGLDEVVYAAKGQRAFLQCGQAPPVAARVTETAELANAMVCYTELEGYDEAQRPEVLRTLVARCRISRGWGDCYGHMLVATGRADVMVDPFLGAWDAAALQPIIEEAGGRFCDWTGNRTIYGGNGFSTNGRLANEVLEIMRGKN